MIKLEKVGTEPYVSEEQRIPKLKLAERRPPAVNSTWPWRGTTATNHRKWGGEERH